VLYQYRWAIFANKVKGARAREPTHQPIIHVKIMVYKPIDTKFAAYYN
jgi:hypothetical protein